MIEEYPTVSVTFGFDGKAGKLIDFGKITNILGISPSFTRTPDEWPEVLKSQISTLPEEVKPRSCWDLEIGYQTCHSVPERFEELLKQLRGKERAIIRLCQEMDLTASIGVGIHMNEVDGPYIGLTPEIMAFASAINAEIGFDVYSYSTYDEELERENETLKKELEKFRTWEATQEEKGKKAK